MSDWREAELGDHVDLLAGFAFKSAKFSDDPAGCVRLLRGDNVGQGALRWTGAKHWSAAEYSDFQRYHLSEDDVILAMDRPWIEAGLKYAYIRHSDLPCLLVQRVSRMRGLQTLDTKFLRYLIGSEAFTGHVKAIITGVNVPHISGRDIKRFRFKLPPLETQRRIASILSAYDDLIDVNRCRLAKLEEMARRLFDEWFVRFRFPGHATHLEIASARGETQVGWERKALSELMSLDKGVSYNGAGLTPDGNPMVNLKNIQAGGGFRRDATKPYSGDFKPRHTVKPGDVIIANTDLTQAGTVVASPALVPAGGDEKPILFSHHLYAVRPCVGIPPLFLYHLMLTDAFRGFAKGFAIGTTVLGLPKAGVLNYSFLCPPLALMEEFAARVSAIHEAEEAYHQQNDKLRASRDLILPRLISGQLSIASAERALEDAT